MASKVVQEFFLGRVVDVDDLFDAHNEEYRVQKVELDRTGRKWPTKLIFGQHRPYIRVNMTLGTKCDLIDMDRSAQILYVCNEDSHKHDLHSIREVSTCEYEVIVLTRSLCKHEDFKSKSDQEHVISCHPVDDSPAKPAAIQADEFEQAKAQKRKEIAYFQGGTLVIEADAFSSFMN